MGHTRLYPKLAALLILGFMALNLGCAEVSVVEPPIKEPLSHIYRANFDQVWRNIQLAMRRYPVRVNNIDAGVLETDYIKGDKIFSEPAPAEVKPQPGLRYKITVRAVKGNSEGTPVVQVTLLKTSELQENFFDGFRPIPTNGLEERTILYRIGRFLEIDQILAKAAQGSGLTAPNK